jgi:hypothetical protein
MIVTKIGSRLIVPMVHGQENITLVVSLKAISCLLDPNDQLTWLLHLRRFLRSLGRPGRFNGVFRTFLSLFPDSLRFHLLISAIDNVYCLFYLFPLLSSNMHMILSNYIGSRLRRIRLLCLIFFP